MLLQKPEQIWDTKPLECWAKAKELRARFYETEKQASDRHVFLVADGDGPQHQMGPAFGNLHLVHPHPEAASIANVSDTFSRECRAATEAYGLGRNLCGYQLDYIGAMLTNRHFSGGPMPKRDIVCQGNDMCAMFPKLGQIEADFWGVPDHHADETGYYGEYDPDRSEAAAKYKTEQFRETLEWLEKVTGTKFNEEAYVENVKRQWRMYALRGDVVETLTHVPSPLDQKSAYSLFTLGGLVGSDPEDTEKFWVELRDEMRYRVANNIAAVPNERFRWTENEPPPWFFLKYYRYMEQYGAVCLQTFYHGIELQEQPDGTYTRPKTPLELGEDVSSVEDVMMAQMSRGGTPSGWGGHGPMPQTYFEKMMNSVKAFHCDGVILPLHRAGIGCVFSMRATAMKLEEAGIPVMHYETSQPGDRTDFDENRMLEQLDTFMEMRGLRKTGGTPVKKVEEAAEEPLPLDTHAVDSPD